jgi:hypothetical protein
MKPDRLKGEPCHPPFPIYEDAVGTLLAAHRSPGSERDPAVAHILALSAGYAYGDIETMATVMSRVGFAEHASVCLSQVVDAMYIFSTAYLTQSRCGRVVILSYRGTQPANLANWLGDADVGSDSMLLGAEAVSVHSGFYRNLRATRIAVIDELKAAAEGRSLVDPNQKVEPMQALYITGHSLGGALAVLLALSLAATPEHGTIADGLRAVYTFAQPMTLDALPVPAPQVTRRLFRHVLPRDIVPALPPGGWGQFAHAGREYRYESGDWLLQPTPIAQLVNIREIARAMVAMLAPASRRDKSKYSLADHGPHHYISALRPRGRITEFGDAG